MKKNLAAIVLCVLFVTSASVASNIIYVDAGGPNDPGTGTSEDPFRSIQDAIEAADNGDTIEIRPGLYTGPGNRDLDPNGKSIIISSVDANDPDVVAATQIDPNGAGRGFYFHSGEDANCVVRGLTVINGYTGGKGAGIYCYCSSPTVTNCIISGNSAGTHGGGLFCQNSSPLIIGCIISGNTSANDGGGIEHWRGKSVLTNCIISNNQANGVGGGADYFDNNDIMLVNCTFAGNSAGSGGALYSWASDVVVKNSVFWANDAESGPQIALSAALNSSISISYSDVQGGETAVHDPAGGLMWDSNNVMDADPCFASFDPNGDPNVWDFHLQSASGRWEPNSRNWIADSNTSRCIDTADPNTHWSVEPWPNGKRCNIGAYGATEQASKNGNPADFDVSGAVDFEDFAGFSGKWHFEGPCIEDLTGNETVDLADLRIFAENWLWQRE